MVDLFTTKAKYIATCKKMSWMRRFFEELGIQQEKHVLNYDSQSLIHLEKNHDIFSKPKHIDIQYHLFAKH